MYSAKLYLIHKISLIIKAALDKGLITSSDIIWVAAKYFVLAKLGPWLGFDRQGYSVSTPLFDAPVQ